MSHALAPLRAAERGVVQDSEFLLQAVELSKYPTISNRAKMYILELMHLQHRGIFTQKTKLFNIMCGGDLFSGFFVPKMWAFDDRPPVDSIAENWFYNCRAHLEEHIRDIFDPWREYNCETTHIDHDIFRKEKAEVMALLQKEIKPGDVVFLKAFLSYAQRSHYSEKTVESWLKELIAILPPGVVIVLFEHEPNDGHQANNEIFDRVIAGYLLGTGSFKNILPQKDIDCLEKIARNIEKVNTSEQSEIDIRRYPDGLYFDVGGNLTVLKKIDTHDTAAPDTPSPSPAAGCL